MDMIESVNFQYESGMTKVISYEEDLYQNY